MNVPLLFIAADFRECAPWVARWDAVSDPGLPVHWARQGKWQGRSVLAIANGAGWSRAEAAFRAAPVPLAVVNIGFCGALDASLRIGDVFVATAVLSEGYTWPAIAPTGPVVKSGLLISTSRIAATAAEKRTLHQTGATVVEMEAAGVARAARLAGVPFYCVRSVSDLADEDFTNDFNKNLMPNGRFSISGLVFDAIKHPIRGFGELIRLSRRTAVASKNLGEFLANCSF